MKANEKPNTPSVTENIMLTDGEDAARTALDIIADLASRCHSVDDRDSGMRFRFAVESDRVAWAAGSDQQVNVIATGTSTTSDSELPVSLAFSFVRVDNVRLMTTFMDFSSDIASAHRDVVDAAVARLRAALEDRDQPAPAGALADYPIGEGFRNAIARRVDS